MAMVTPRFIASACAAAGLAACLSGCVLGSRGQTVALSEPEPVPAKSGLRGGEVKTVRRVRAAGTDEPAASGGATVADAMPSPSQIFDFHPPGSKPDAWRQPFIIDYTDGPLNRYRADTAAELKRLQAGDARPLPQNAATP